MGAELKCTAEYNGQSGQGTALLETDHVLFRGDFRVKLFFRDIVTLAADSSTFSAVTKDGELKLHLGRAATRWKQKIENPPSLLEKLRVKPGLKVAALQIDGDDFLRQIKSTARAGVVDILFMGARIPDDLERIPDLIGRMERNGALWVVYPKGRKEITENAVIAAGRRAGLKDVKVVSFSSTHTALKFVIPVTAR